MPNPIKQLRSAAAMFGVDLKMTARSVRGLGPFQRNYREFFNQAGPEFGRGKLYPCLHDRYEQGGAASGHYFHQDLYVAQLIFKNNPVRHIDVGSRVDGFVAHVATFRQIEVFDIREVTSTASNIVFRQRDLMQERPDLDECTDSLSCLHTLEHFGLGRYGDPVDYYGYKRGWESLCRMLKPGGKFYFAVPIGPQRVEFDAHRIFAVPYLVDMIKPKYRIDSFAYVDQRGDLVRDADPTGPAAADNFGCKYGCGIFELTRL
jgi:hypothetical protein